MGSYIGVVKYLNTYNRMSHGKTIENERFFGRTHKTALSLIKFPLLQLSISNKQQRQAAATSSSDKQIFWIFLSNSNRFYFGFLDEEGNVHKSVDRKLGDN